MIKITVKDFCENMNFNYSKFRKKFNDDLLKLVDENNEIDIFELFKIYIEHLKNFHEMTLLKIDLLKEKIKIEKDKAILTSIAVKEKKESLIEKKLYETKILSLASVFTNFINEIKLSNGTNIEFLVDKYNKIFFEKIDEKTRNV